MHELKLREMREKKDLTQREVAQHLNVTREAYAHYESGVRQMNYETMCVLADFYDVSIDYLLGRYETNAVILSKKEINLIESYRMLDERGKAGVEATLNFEYGQSTRANETKKNTM